jgi:flagellar motor switch protein FliM
LQELETRELKESDLIEKGLNQFSYTLPHSNTPITFKLLNTRDDRKVKAEVKGLQKINKRSNPELSTRLKHVIISVNGDENPATIREFVDKFMLARDSRALREHIRTFQPDIDLKFNYESSDGVEREVSLPMTVNFFWPDADL